MSTRIVDKALAVKIPRTDPTRDDVWILLEEGGDNNCFVVKTL
jgi:hypothetical protein